MLRKGRLVTTPVTADILESITSSTVIQLCRDIFNIQVEVRDIDRTELYVAEEIFFCGTLSEIVPVISVDRIPVGTGRPGTLTKNIQEAYFKIVKGEDDCYVSWRTPIYGHERS
jgi:branched-chain amino acid aminotransferase